MKQESKNGLFGWILSALILLHLLFQAVCANKTDGVFLVTKKCQNGWEKHGQNCYYWDTRDLVTWQEASQECRLDSSNLLMIHSVDEENWLRNKTMQYSMDGWWIGMQYSDKGYWHWIDSSIISETYIHWSKEPDNYNNQDCVALNINGNISDENCANKYGYICKYKLPQSNPDQLQQSCPQKWNSLNYFCYYVSDPIKDEKLSWNDAKAKCKSMATKLNIHLLSISTKDELTIVQSSIPYNFGTTTIPWWIGLNDIQNEGQYVWSDGTTFDYSLLKWDKAPNINHAKLQNCGMLRGGGVIHDNKCDKRAYYICKESATTVQVDLGCGSWTRGGHFCYFFGDIRNYTWQQAKQKCQSKKADLLSVGSSDEKFWIEYQTTLEGITGWWTGLNNINSDKWVWSDGSVADSKLIRWDQEPNSYTGNEDCATVSNDGVYTDLNCALKAGYICEYYLDPAAKCKNSAWLKNGNSCYYFSSSNSTDYLNWFEVAARCNDLASSTKVHRVSISSESEMNFVLQQLAKMQLTSVGWWTGLNDRNTEGEWEWTDDSSNPPNVSLIQWGGEPDNKNGNEHCAAMFFEGRYNDMECSTPATFICKRPLASEAARNNIYTLILLTTIVCRNFVNFIFM